MSIPPVLNGPVFNLNVQSGSKIFYNNVSTPTYGINGVWMSPTLVVNKGDSVVLNVINGLNVKTTMHWHGLHVAAKNDGGPHQIIDPQSTWSPGFRIRNEASTYWYHPHGAGQTDPQVSKGLAGLIIVGDSSEAKLVLPRTYGVDDIPVIIQSKAFDDLGQIAIATDMDTALFVNGTLNPKISLPAQVVRFRVLNGSSLRSYYLGLTNNKLFYQIGTDGGLLDSSRALTRLLISPGERAELLVDISGMNGQSFYLRSFASEMPNGVYGSSSVGGGSDTIHDYNLNFLNGADFNLLQIDVTPAISGAVTQVPLKLVPYKPFDLTNINRKRTIEMDTIRLLSFETPNMAEGPFGMNRHTFDMDSVNETVFINDKEIWNLVNRTLIAHPFHIHDIQFNIVERNGKPAKAADKGWKDVVLVMPEDSIKFVTRFTTFSDNNVPYMFHCHLLHHEDDGMMGSFLVIDTLTAGVNRIETPLGLICFPNPTDNLLNVKLPGPGDYNCIIFNSVGEKMLSIRKISGTESLDISLLKPGVYFIQCESNRSIYYNKIIKQ